MEQAKYVLSIIIGWLLIWTMITFAFWGYRGATFWDAFNMVVGVHLVMAVIVSAISLIAWGCVNLGGK
jgi:hypothetical protein